MWEMKTDNIEIEICPVVPVGWSIYIVSSIYKSIAHLS